MNHQDEERSAWSLAMEWSSRVSNIGLEMVLPVAGGYGLDRWLGTSPLFLLLGAALGCVLGMVSLLRLAKSGNSRKKEGD